MKKYLNPEIEILPVETEDVILASNPGTTTKPGDTDFDGWD